MILHELPVVSKKIIVTRIICVCWFIGKIMSWKLWIAGRLFPVVPVFDVLHAPAFVHVLLFILSLTGLILLFLFPAKRIFQITIIIIETITCLLDQNRLQPWEYEYAFMIIAVMINFKKDDDAVKSIMFILISTYFYSGLGKMNRIFSQILMQDITHINIKDLLDAYWYRFITYHSGYILGLLEVFFAMGLLFKIKQKIAAWLLILMHCSIIVVFSPLILNYDVIILPWNMAFALMLYFLFIRKQGGSPFSFIFLRNKRNWLIVVLFGAFPLLNFFGYWDNFLSANLFSYKNPGMFIYIQQPSVNNPLSKYYEAFPAPDGKQRVAINVRSWAFKEMHVPEYPEMRIYKKIKSQLMQRYPGMVADYVVTVYKNGKRIIIPLK